MKMTDTETLIKALRILANDIQSDDGIANAAIAEAADRLEKLSNEASNHTSEVNQRHEIQKASLHVIESMMDGDIYDAQYYFDRWKKLYNDSKYK
jgi:hypothetical protein